MVALSDLTFLARGLAGGIKNVAGSAITVALSTLARGLRNASTVYIDAYDSGSGASSVIVVNTAVPGATANLIVSGDIANNGDIAFSSGTSFIGAFRHAITAARDWTFPDATGTVALKGINNAFSTTQSVTGAVNASSTVSVKNNGSTQSITFTGNPTGNRVVTFPDADITIGASIYIGSDTKANLNALPPSATPITAFCTDIVGAGGGGVLGVQVYWCPAPTSAWLRYGSDTPI